MLTFKNFYNWAKENSSEIFRTLENLPITLWFNSDNEIEVNIPSFTECCDGLNLNTLFNENITTKNNIEVVYEYSIEDFKNEIIRVTKNRKVKDIRYSTATISDESHCDVEYSAVIVFDE